MVLVTMLVCTWQRCFFFRFEEDPRIQKAVARGENVHCNEVWKARAD